MEKVILDILSQRKCISLRDLRKELRLRKIDYTEYRLKKTLERLQNIEIMKIHNKIIIKVIE